MFYYIENNKITAISETKIAFDKNKISQIENDKLDNPFFENGELIEYENSQEYQQKLQEEELKQQTEQENILQEELENMQRMWYDCEINNWEVIKLSTENNLNIDNKIKESEIKQKYQDLIYAKYPLHTQNNLQARMTEINTLAKLDNNRDYTDEEKGEIQELQNILNWIREQREACNLEISNLTA